MNCGCSLHNGFTAFEWSKFINGGVWVTGPTSWTLAHQLFATWDVALVFHFPFRRWDCFLRKPRSHYSSFEADQWGYFSVWKHSIKLAVNFGAITHDGKCGYCTCSFFQAVRDVTLYAFGPGKQSFDMSVVTGRCGKLLSLVCSC